MNRLFLPLCFCVLPLLAAPLPILTPANSSPAESLAAHEVRRYVYLRTGVLLPIQTQSKKTGAAYIFVGRKDQPEIKGLESDVSALKTLAELKPQEYLLKKTGANSLLIAGGDDAGVLYGAYAFAEKLGVRFYLHGDVVPDERIPFSIPDLNEMDKPLFALRGILPFNNFPEGPDWWNTDDYLAYISQLAKMRMNFMGLHCYPKHDLGSDGQVWQGTKEAEPLVWIGTKDEMDEKGNVQFSYPSFWATTSKGGAYGYTPTKTRAFAGGASLLFAADSFGNEVQAGLMPRPKTPHECNEIFDRTAVLLRRAFEEAKSLGVKTCIGTETPLTIPSRVKEHLKIEGKNPENPSIVRELYDGMFARIERACPVDYYWLWTPESWTWGGNNPKQFEETKRDIQAALDADKALGHPFTLATCGWVLGPQHDRAALDQFLPKDSPMSCINRHVGHDAVEPAFANIAGRPKWAIPWMENDSQLTQPQPWVGRMRYDAADARRLGCTGLLGIHWRTKAMMQNVAALAEAAWDQSWIPASFNPNPSQPQSATAGKDRGMPAADFYADFARANFGANVAAAAGSIMEGVDGVKMPTVTDWKFGPGWIVVTNAPWQQVKKQFEFVESLAKLRLEVRGAGNLERFDYWLNTYRAAESMARIGCMCGELDRAFAAVTNTTDDAVKGKLAQDALAVRVNLARAWETLLSFQTAAADTPGELGTIANLEMKSRSTCHLFDKYDQDLATALGGPIPAEAAPSTNYDGAARIIVPTVRTQIEPGESLNLKVIVLDNQPAKTAALFWRKLGRGGFHKVNLKHIARAIYSVTLPAANEDFEYYISAKTASGENLVWPATAPEQNQTIVLSFPALTRLLRQAQK
jgi:hypothetical protein